MNLFVLITLVEFFVVETPLFVLSVFAMLSVESLTTNPSLMLVLQIIAFAVTLGIWIVVTCCCGGGANAGDDRLKALASSRRVYFLVAAACHALALFMWIVYADKYGDLDVVSASVNLAAFIPRQLVYTVQTLLGVMLLMFLLYDMRHGWHREKTASISAKLRQLRSDLQQTSV